MCMGYIRTSHTGCYRRLAYADTVREHSYTELWPLSTIVVNHSAWTPAARWPAQSLCCVYCIGTILWPGDIIAVMINIGRLGSYNVGHCGATHSILQCKFVGDI